MIEFITRIEDDGTVKTLNRDGLLHSFNDKPAIVRANGNQLWYTNGKQNRDDDKPAIMCGDGSQEWYTNGKLNRGDDKPAIMWANGSQEWYTNGERYTPSPIKTKNNVVVVMIDGVEYVPKA